MSKNTITALNNLGWNVTSGAAASIIGGALDTFQSKLANGGRDEKVKFYWDYGKGGSIWNVIARTIVGGAVTTVTQEALSQYKKLIGGKKVDTVSVLAQRENEILKAAHKEDEDKYGRIYVNNNSKEPQAIRAYDDWGNVCVDALMLSIPVATPISVRACL